jgi:hypothetical protein
MKGLASMQTLYKVLREDGSAYYGGAGNWHLPKGKRPGKWMAKIEELVMCQSGYHVCNQEQLIQWLGPAIYEVEVRGETIQTIDKSVHQQARLLRKLNWNERTARLFACDCAQRAIDKYRTDKSDARFQQAIDTARKFAEGAATKAELWAARSAAYSAAFSAAFSAATSAAYNAAYSAAFSAARSAAHSAACSAAHSAAYSAAFSAARSAAHSAACSAAHSAACSAERKWQSERLFEYLYS